MTPATVAGVTAVEVTTARLRARVLRAGEGEPVLFLHGNVSSATWWEEVMATLPAGYSAIAPDQRGFGDADPEAVIDATRGVGDLADDAAALLDHFDIERAHVVGHSMGGNVVWRLLMDHAERLASVTLVCPGSPYGFGGTRGLHGAPCHSDHAGSGAGLVNPALVASLAARDAGADTPASPRSLLRTVITRPGRVLAREDALVASMLATHLGERAYPGDSVSSPRWPFVAPGRWGVNNALSPRYCGDIAAIARVPRKPPILWLRGSDDVIVSNRAAGDPGTWGPGGHVPGYPGPDVYPPQPMLGQTRAVLERYAAAGGVVAELVLCDTGHSPYLEDLPAFNSHFHAHLRAHPLRRS